MRRFLASTAIAMATLAMASGTVWAKGPGNEHSDNGNHGNKGSLGNSIQNLSKSWNQSGNKSWTQNNASGNQAGSKYWKQPTNKSGQQGPIVQQKFDSHKHPDFMGGSGIHDNWRYRWNNGRWWFWAPDNRWAWYNDGRWSYGDSYAVRRPIFEDFSGGPIKIVNPASNRTTLRYTLDGVVYSIPPGYSQQLRDDRPWVILFSRGPGMEEAQYRLRSGRYAFTSTNHGWELYRSNFSQPTAPENPPPQPPENPPAQTPGNAPVQAPENPSAP